MNDVDVFYRPMSIAIWKLKRASDQVEDRRAGEQSNDARFGPLAKQWLPPRADARLETRRGGNQAPCG